MPAGPPRLIARSTGMRLPERPGEIVDLLDQAGLAARRLGCTRAMLQAAAAAGHELLSHLPIDVSDTP